MSKSASLRPTLWRTCRVLANHSRLKIIALLARDPPQTVSSVAIRLELSLSGASEYLRALEARSLLSARRIGRRVEYRLNPDAGTNDNLVQSLRQALRQDTPATDAVFHACTAFTHPRRIEIFRSLSARSQILEQLQAATRIPPIALFRHWGKLESRG